ncbi:hypothetical protein [Novipirellula rosea]|uniref:FAD/NAD(P)-binding domain-containing protein n=1 Tax=Novipirellula rosea TaxID=1031540 RepID=A0ABP8MWY2_9BACT
MTSETATLDPPGSIAIVGAGPLGVEAALYGRFLGYNVTLIEAAGVGHSQRVNYELPLPVMPHECLSPLAVSALHAQDAELLPQTLPMTYQDWVEKALKGIVAGDLLEGRLRCPSRVTKISTVPVELDEEDSEDDDPIPPDFRLELTSVYGQADPLDSEAVILAIGDSAEIPLDFSLPADYFFRIGQSSTGNLAEDLKQGRQEIVTLFAGLAGRETLDLYRPRRSE